AKVPRPNRPERSRHGTGKRRKKTRHHAPAVPVAAPAAPPVAAPVEVNVELVPLPPPTAQLAPAGLRLGRRDALSVAVGAAAGAGVTVLGGLSGRLGKKEG